MNQSATDPERNSKRTYHFRVSTAISVVFSIDLLLVKGRKQDQFKPFISTSRYSNKTGIS